MNRRADEARENLKKWKGLLSDATDLCEAVERLEHRNESAIEDVESEWSDSVRDVQSAKTHVAAANETHQAIVTDTEAFDETDASELPTSTTDVESVHTDRSRLTPGGTNSETPTREDVREALNDHSEPSEVERDRPIPFTERPWFAAHSDRFPIGEEVFRDTPADEVRRGSGDPDSTIGARRDESRREARREDDGENP